jgi:glutathione reductase (NADPH)
MRPDGAPGRGEPGCGKAGAGSVKKCVRAACRPRCAPTASARRRDAASTALPACGSLYGRVNDVLYVGGDGVAFFTIDVLRERLYVLDALSGVQVFASALVMDDASALTSTTPLAAPSRTRAANVSLGAVATRRRRAPARAARDSENSASMTARQAPAFLPVQQRKPEPTMEMTHDLIVIGGGSGGVAGSRRAAAHGAKVAIVESDRFGGTCVIRGCVPKKLMMYAAGFAHQFREAEGFGWRDVQARFEMPRWADAKAAEIRRLERIYDDMLANGGVEIVRGRGRLTSANEVDVAGRRLAAPRILIATGGAPSADAFPGLAEAMTSNEVLDLRELPASLLVIGGGYIAVEFASILAALGVAVTLAFRDRHPLRGFDAELRGRLALALGERGIALAAGVALERLEREPEGFALHRADGSVLRARAALNATGRRPHTAGLGLGDVGVALNARGAIVVDAESRSSVPTIWAVGDVTDRVNLTPVAIAEARAFADTEFDGDPKRVDHRVVASAVFTDPPIGSVGLSEEQAALRGPVDVYAADFRPMKTAFAGGTARTFMKLVVDGLDQRVLGVQMIGPEAPEIVQCLAVAVTCGARKRDFDQTIAVHPTLAEEFMLMRTPVRRVAQAKGDAVSS